MKNWLVTMLLLNFCLSGQSQVLDEWTNQSATQKKYLVQQIASLKVYIDYLEKGYNITEKGLNTISDLKNGEGKVFKYENEAIALHKDEQGELHALHPICTHLKCEVKFNQAEQTWDCPCHGARYAIDGDVITAPANQALELVSIKKEENA